MATKISKNALYNISQLNNEFVSFLSRQSGADADNNLANFTTFLQSASLSTAHAQEIYEYMTGAKKKLEISNFRMRKLQPKRDFFLKKVLVPTAVTSALIGGTAGAITASQLPGGATALGIIPVSATPGLTLMSTALVGATAGLLLTPALILTKNALVKGYYSLMYKSADKNLSDLESGVNIDALPISKLMSKVEETSHKIYNLNNGNWFQRTGAHFLNMINRNRIHHIEKVTSNLCLAHRKSDMDLIVARSAGDTARAKTLEGTKTKITKILRAIDGFMTKNIEESKLSALLSCKNSGPHAHTAMVENVDIFASIKIHGDAISDDKPISEATVRVKNIATKQSVAQDLMKGTRIFPKMINPNMWLVGRYEKHTDKIRLISQDGTNVVEFQDTYVNPAKGIEAVETTTKGIVVYYDDNTSTLIPKFKKASNEEIINIEAIYDALTDPTYLASIQKRPKSYTDKNDGTKHQYNTSAVITSLTSSMASWLATPVKPEFITTPMTDEEKKLYQYLIKNIASIINKTYITNP